MVPTFRADVRYFELENGQGWFGGGGDLTPYYLFDDDAKEFHQVYKNTCDKYSSSLYPTMKEWCDNYFYIPARQEHRGVGGIFFDDLSWIDGGDMSGAFDFTCDVCKTFMPSYLPIVKRRRSLSYTDEQRHFQLLRRGRYIEFNMLYDRGVKFGLVPGGRIEAVMVSCPPLVAWDYNYTPETGSEEERLMKILRAPIEWAL
jgi:coproporphyrinogen III oxidase